VAVPDLLACQGGRGSHRDARSRPSISRSSVVQTAPRRLAAGQPGSDFVYQRASAASGWTDGGQAGSEVVQ
jgi:hypothetical protein